MRAIAAVLLFGAGFGPLAPPGLALAQSASEQQNACMGDAFKFCAGDIPNRQRVGACLTAHREQISPECRTMIDGGRTTRPARRG